MIQSPNLRNLYKPVQPTVKPTASNVSYQEFLPDARLQPFIYCYWQLKTTQPLTEPFSYRVVADGCMDIFFELDRSQENFVMGFSRKYTKFILDHSFHYIGIRFLPTMFPQVFRVSAVSLSNRFEHLSNVIPETSAFIHDYFSPELDIPQIISGLDAYFLLLLSKVNVNQDNRLYQAIEHILQHSGTVAIETDLDTGISPRQLRRLFEFYIGDTPKTFSQVIRFQQLLHAKPSSQSLRKNKLFFDMGYYDQAHFIKEFHTFYGLTPGQAFK